MKKSDIYPENKDNCPLVRQWPKSHSKDLPKSNTSTKLSLIDILNILEKQRGGKNESSHFRSKHWLIKFI